MVNQALRAWDQPVVDGRTLPRIAGISSFGAGGVECAHDRRGVSGGGASADGVPRQVAIVLSARTAEQLQQKARDLLDLCAHG